MFLKSGKQFLFDFGENLLRLNFEPIHSIRPQKWLLIVMI
jgi:hypothetical protein